MLKDAGIPVLNPVDYISSHARRDDWHPADTTNNRLMQAQLFADASYVARGFGFLKQVRLNKTAAPHSYSYWPAEFFPPVEGDPDSKERVRALVANIEENVKNSRTSAATARMSAEAVAGAHRAPPAATAPATSSAPMQPKAKAVTAWAPSLPQSPLPPLQKAPTPKAKNQLPSLFAAMEIGSDSRAAASGRRETSDATSSSEHNKDQIIMVVLPFCGDASLKYLSRRASGVLRHSYEAKKATDGVMPIHAFCQNFEKRRSLSDCLASIVRGSDKARFEIGMQTPGGAVPAFLTKATKLSFDEASGGFE